MVYSDFQGIKLSQLGMGAMRLPVIDGREDTPDEEKTAQMVDYAMAQGINYFDTAWGYHKGNSEIVMGKCLKKYPRDKFFLASKFPGYDLSNMGKAEEIFERQLEKCQVEYFDFYLFHNVCEMNIEQYLNDEKFGTYSYLLSQKKNGRIKHLGFSSHGSYDVMKRFLDKYGSDMEFCQIQLNWIDWEFQNAKDKVELLRQYNIPIWVMEPLRGGKLAKLSDENEKVLNELRSDESIPAWAFRFLQSIEGVKVILSGMSSYEQIEDNIKTFRSNKPLTEKEMSVLTGIAKNITNKTALPCTACRYCTAHCPKGLNIPELISLYNEHAFTGGGFIAPMVLMTYEESKKPMACIGCKSCEKVCPQQIGISMVMADFSKRLK